MNYGMRSDTIDSAVDLHWIADAYGGADAKPVFLGTVGPLAFVAAVAPGGGYVVDIFKTREVRSRAICRLTEHEALAVSALLRSRS